MAHEKHRTTDAPKHTGDDPRFSTECPLCRNEAVRIVAETHDYNWRAVEGTFRYVKCHTCSLVWQYPLPAAHDLSSLYPPSYGGGKKRLSREERVRAVNCRPNATRAEAIGRMRRRPGSILDVGCGSGAFLAYMTQRGWRVSGLETSAENIARAQSEFGLRNLHRGVWPGDAPPRSFDVISMYHVLEHLPDPIAGLRTARDHLNPGGCIAVETPNIEGLAARLFGSRCTIYDAPRHLFLFDRSSLQVALQRSGFGRPLLRSYSPAVLEYTESLRYLVQDLGLRRYPARAAPPQPENTATSASASRSGARGWVNFVHDVERHGFRAVAAIADAVGKGSALLAVAQKQGACQ